MSHYTVLHTRIIAVDALVKALADVGLKRVEVHGTAEHLHGYRGDAWSQTAKVIVRRKFVGAASNDIGFRRQADGTFDTIISDYDRHKYSPEWLQRLTRRYAYSGVHQS